MLALFIVSSLLYCSKSPEEQAISKADDYYKKATEALKEGKQRTYLVYSNRALKTLLRYMQKDSPTVKVRAKYILINIDLGKNILKNYAADTSIKEKIYAFYEDINNYLFKYVRDTIKYKDKNGNVKTKIKETKIRDLPPEVYSKYAEFLVAIADTIKNYESVREGFKYLKYAQLIDSTNSIVKSEMKKWYKELAQDALERAKEYYEAIDWKDPDPDDAIAAEYFTLLTLKYDPNNKEAKEMLKKIRPAMAGIYSAYIRLIDVAGLEPEEIDDDINNNNVLLAVVDFKRRGKSAVVEVSIYNNSYNPIEIRPEVFYLVDKDGNKYQAKRTNRKDEIPSKILDTEWEERGKLYFYNIPKKADIVALMYYMERPDKDAPTGKEIHKAIKYIK